ncbi:hypothetical protein LTR93_002608 [Exophiala xenobiotica]|nr:hypothetical protein LTR93_002608 [Exophiala xenobiotica]
MASPQDFTPLAGIKAKQERIRDNQRRSRARRQEYLAELEQRLEQCRVTCRDADLLRQSFYELQAENHHLRELLSTAGVSSDLVESSLRQRSQQSSSNSDQRASIPNTTNLRQLKPKLNPHALPTNVAPPTTWKSHHRSMSMSATQSVHSKTQMSSASSSCCAEVPRISPAPEVVASQVNFSSFIDQLGLPMTTTGEISGLAPSTSTGNLALDWLFDDPDISWDNYAIQSNEHFTSEHESIARPTT